MKEKFGTAISVLVIKGEEGKEQETGRRERDGNQPAIIFGKMNDRNREERWRWILIELMMVLLLLLLFSNESGQDNPFRPDGDLSREADELVELLKGGRPISEVLKPKEEVPSSASPTAEEPVAEEQPFLAASPDRNSLASPTNKSPTNKSPDVGVNGVKTPEAEKKVVEKEVEASKSVEVERAVVAPTEANPSQAEHVVIKKKSKCQCCVIQ